MSDKKRNSFHISQQDDTLTISARFSIEQTKAVASRIAIAIGSATLWVLSNLPIAPPQTDRQPVLPSAPSIPTDRANVGDSPDL